MQRSQRVTLADIAARSGVSTATASMILSERPDVSFSRETVLKVREAAEALGYRGIRRHRPSHLMAEKSVAILCPNVVNPYYATLVQSVQDAAARHDYDTMVFPTYRDAAVEARLLRTLSAASIGGIVFCAMPLCPAQAELANRETPVVVIGDRDASLNLDTVELNNYNAGVLVARYLIGLGHRSVACIATPLNKDNSARLRRLEGLRDVFREACPEGRFLVRTCTITPEQERGDLNIEHRTGYTLARRCMAERDITAFVAVNDMVAYGVLDAILESGARVPEDYSLCGFALLAGGPDHGGAPHRGKGPQRAGDAPQPHHQRPRVQHHPRGGDAGAGRAQQYRARARTAAGGRAAGQAAGRRRGAVKKI